MAQTPHSVEVDVQKTEKWWGLVVDNRHYLTPFKDAFSLNTTQLSPMRFSANMLLSDRGRYIWSDEPMEVRFDGNSFTIKTKKEAAEVKRAGKSLREAYLVCCHKNFPPQTVKAAEMLFRSPIYELGGRDALLYTQTDVEQFADCLRKAGAPDGTILIPQGWHSPSGTLGFDRDAYPSPKEMIEHLHLRGMKVMLTVTPYVMAAGRGFQQSRKDGTLLKDGKGKPLVFESRLGYTACSNLSAEEAGKMNAALKALQADYGIDGFYFDCLDVVPVIEGNTLRIQSFLKSWNKVSEGIDAAIYSSPTNIQLSGAVSAVSNSRTATWQTLSETLETAVDAAVLGFSRTCMAADLDFTPNDNDLILRTAQLAALLPVAIIPYEVWTIDNKDAIKAILTWRQKAGQYILSLAQESARTAEPIIRHLEYQYPRNGFGNCRDQFMIGNRYLVAPVLSSGGRRMVRLPRGKWSDGKGRTYKGPRVIDVDVNEGRTAIFEQASK